MITQFFFFNDTATTEIYTLSLHDALPISYPRGFLDGWYQGLKYWWFSQHEFRRGDQPWYYYLMLLPIYELMALVFGLGGIVALAWGRRRLRAAERAGPREAPLFPPCPTLRR